MNVVYVLSANRMPLMPCLSVIARLLLKDGKAKVVRRTPFTIKLLFQPEDTYAQPLTLGVDTGSAVVGSAVADERGTVVYLSAIEVRNDIARTMKERAASRRNRRTRKTRYRPARWLNRKNSIKTGRFSPTMRSKIEAHLREIRFVQSLLPIIPIVLETGTFDPHALKNPVYKQIPGNGRSQDTPQSEDEVKIDNTTLYQQNNHCDRGRQRHRTCHCAPFRQRRRTGHRQ